jgi:hypothetical protein
MTENLSRVEEIRKVYSRIKCEIEYSMSHDPHYKDTDLSEIKEVLCSTERDCMDNGVNPNRYCFWYHKSSSLLYAFGKMISKKEPECSESQIIEGLLGMSGCSYEDTGVILEGIKKRKNLESEVVIRAI